jgi:hypothetical protein
MKKEKQTAEEPIVKAAKAIGTAAGKVAALAGVHEGAPRVAAHPAGSGKFEKKNKSRLPRKVKKVHQKKAALAV